jgi:hypothetical protein
MKHGRKVSKSMGEIHMKENKEKSLRLSERWLEQAEADLEAAQDSLRSNHFE